MAGVPGFDSPASLRQYCRIERIGTMTDFIDPTDLSALWIAVIRHPDTLDAVLWQVQDVRYACEDAGVDFDSVDVDAIDLRGWEEITREDGWCAIHHAVTTYAQVGWTE